jgi:hypothetical protein
VNRPCSYVTFLAGQDSPRSCRHYGATYGKASVFGLRPCNGLLANSAAPRCARTVGGTYVPHR